jgi:hypothetical protein
MGQLFTKVNLGFRDWSRHALVPAFLMLMILEELPGAQVKIMSRIMIMSMNKEERSESRPPPSQAFCRRIATR